MKTGLLLALAAALLLGSAEPGDAKKPGKKYRHYASEHARAEYHSKARSGRIERQKEYMADKMPIGSQDWWDQMTRESRTVCCN